MDIKSVVPTAEIEFTLDRKDAEGKPATVKLTTCFVAIDEVRDFIKPGERFRFSKAIREVLIDAVVGWDLTQDGKPIPCDEENKRKILPVLFGTRLAGEEDHPYDLLLGLKLCEFAGDDRNFLKN